MIPVRSIVPPPTVTVEGGYFHFIHDDRVVYDIAVTDAGNALRWIEHIAPKSWATKQHLEDFARLAADHVGARYR